MQPQLLLFFCGTILSFFFLDELRQLDKMCI